MTLPGAQLDELGLVLVGAAMAALLITFIALVLRSRGCRRQRGVSGPRREEPAAKRPALDGAALMAAVGEAEADGQVKRLPGLYLSLAQWRLDSGETAVAEDLLRKSIRTATTAGLNDAHAKARLALGDIAHSNGDLATACEHWQIARLLFRELRQSREHDAVEGRMQRNGCPTDWVLTDF